MKKKSKVLMIGAVVAAVSMFAVTAMASTPKTSGYDAFKEVLKANHQSGDTFQSATVNGSFTFNLDGKTIVKADGTMKAGASGNVSGDFDFSLAGVERSGSIYSSSDDLLYFVDQTHDLHYQVINLNDEHTSKHKEWQAENELQSRPMTKAEEVFLDFVVGDLKDDFSVANHADGSKTITLYVSKEDVPLPLRLLVDVAASADKSKSERDHDKGIPAELERLKLLPFFQGLEKAMIGEQMPDLTNDVKIEHIRLQLVVDANNELQGMQGELEVSGKDDSGVKHRVEMNGEGYFSGINATTPDKYSNPAGKSIEIIDGAMFDDHR